MGKITPFRLVRTGEVSPLLWDRIGQIWRGLLWALLLALSIVALAKIEGLSRKVENLSKDVGAKTDSEELARTRYEALLREIHETKGLVRYQNALYDDDVRRGIEPKAR